LLFGSTVGEVTFVPSDELHPPGEDEPLVKTALPLFANFLFFGTFTAFPISFFSDTIFDKSAAKSAMVSANKKNKTQVKIEDRKFINTRK
jgi:hypothetical protein